MAIKMPASGQLLSLDTIDGSSGVPAAKQLLKTRSPEGGISTWDASSIFFEMDNLKDSEAPSPRTLVLLYAADLFFRLRWQIIPALHESKCVVAVPYVRTCFAFGVTMGLPEKWLTEVFRFAPEAAEHFHVNRKIAAGLGDAHAGFVEFCSKVLKQDLRPKVAAYFKELEHNGASRPV